MNYYGKIYVKIRENSGRGESAQQKFFYKSLHYVRKSVINDLSVITFYEGG